ncbi:Macrolide export ATP-binding/permease protein MacB [Aquisphaera giovannonii]|uniref:Macrolide export ATP-binding/permease protein MacB n=1 Tax=Aquisphaera giovannonii TaxID=406548 RepID=A0A5B9VXC8_9BACT|nr:ABC transporter permease [Aquisphaera giovannonii]QEH32617.1 Macrolide export ATP-binding/permease protein MacB [Aquisphaera giovannonii]
MRFITLMARNLFRRRTRTLLTAVGLALAIATVLDLVGIAWNFERAFLTLFVGKGIDLVVVRAGTSNQLSSALDQGLADRIRSLDGVKEVAASLLDTVGFEQAQIASAIVNGWEPDSLLFRGSHLLEGRSFHPGETNVTLLGRVLALNLGKKAGDPLDVAGEPFRVIGVFESDSAFESGALIMPLATLQKLMGREGQVTGIVVEAKSSEKASIEALRKSIESEIPGVAATPARDYVERDVQIRLVKVMAWATTVLSLVLGAVGMLNTMIMAVFERTREIGVLRALGWRRTRVLRLILGESIILGLVGAALGMVLAILGLRVLMLAPTAQGFVDPRLPAPVLAFGLVMGLALSVLGGLYPALRAASLDPSEALRHE